MITLPAQQLQMGSTRYYLAAMSASELVRVVRPAAEALDDWDTMSIEDRIQREVNVKRLHEEVVPYLAQHPDRFFGSVIVLLDGNITFESLDSLNPSLPLVYRNTISRLGVLTVEGGHMIALDGQHRLVALREILERRYKGEFDPSIGDDDISVMFIEQESVEKTRRIFNKVNRYARSTSRADNLILSEDDGYAIISRRLFSEPGAPLFHSTQDGGLVNWRNNTISARSLQLTTISALSIMVRDICEAHGIILDEKAGGGNRPSDAALARGYELSAAWIQATLDGFDVLRDAVKNPARLPSERTLEAPHSLLLKPAGQIALIRAARRWYQATESDFDIRQFIGACSRIGWSVQTPYWEGVLVLGGSRILAKKTNYDDASLLICWLAMGDTPGFPTSLKDQLDERWAVAHADHPKSLPTPRNTPGEL